MIYSMSFYLKTIKKKYVYPIITVTFAYIFSEYNNYWRIVVIILKIKLSVIYQQTNKLIRREFFYRKINILKIFNLATGTEF